MNIDECRTSKAIIVPDLLDVIDDFFKGTEGHRNDPEFLSLCNRIAGKEVQLKFLGKDAFEVVDNNYWLPDCCFMLIEEDI